MLRIGVTGGIGSGKTTVCEVWNQKGAYVVYADQLAREIMVADEEVKERIIALFGAEAYQNNGALNKEYLAREAFQGNRVEALNEIVHPKVYEATNREMESAEQKGYKLFVKEAALLLKKGRPDSLDTIVMVKADQQKRVERVARRDGTTEEEILQRIGKQQDFAKLEGFTDYIIENNGSMEELKNKAEKLFERITAMEIRDKT